MKIIRLLLKNSWQIFLLGAIASIITGASSAGLIAVINYILQNLEQTTAGIVGSFIGLCLLLMVSSASSWILLSRLSQDIIYDLRLEITQNIFACPLRQLEIIGAPKLLATLTADINTIANSSAAISALGVSIALVLGCLVYLCWLSLPVFLIFLFFIILGILSYQFLASKGLKWFKIARETQDDLFQHFQTVTQGTKELKLHRQRRQTFFQEDLKVTASALRFRWMKAMTIYAIANGYGLVLFFIPLGLMLLFLTKIMTISTAVLSGYTVTLLYMITPLRGILNQGNRIKRIEKKMGQ
ncbi:MAG: ABC transporter transmembrane domain-containing protein [Xenococcaceae cyanobacterium MO_188.B29]|nr:ABC transporter transmembrane domain-containing protein [Xenococcaceae cyanobacterium MO_188.B29]